MKRSQINALIEEAKLFFERHHFALPVWALWALDDWQQHEDDCEEIFTNRLGWDVTDNGGGDFEKMGLLLFTIRNGRLGCDNKTYAEKIMIVRENQETPMHFHWNKMEDIINRGGGNLVMELFASTPSGGLSRDALTVSIDGVRHHLSAGGQVVLRPGQSICLQPGVYHRFWGEPQKGWVLVGEVSSVNDDKADNRFYEERKRFPSLDEDAPVHHLLVTDYENTFR